MNWGGGWWWWGQGDDGDRGVKERGGGGSTLIMIKYSFIILSLIVVMVLVHVLQFNTLYPSQHFLLSLDLDRVLSCRLLCFLPFSNLSL